MGKVSTMQVKSLSSELRRLHVMFQQPLVASQPMVYSTFVKKSSASIRAWNSKVIRNCTAVEACGNKNVSCLLSRLLVGSSWYLEMPDLCCFVVSRSRMISSMNATDSGDVLTLLLVGIPGLEHVYSWILLLFCIFYAISLTGNSVLFLLIRTDVSLQTPMYELVSMLALADLCLSLATLPTVLGVFGLQSLRLPVPMCLFQMFFIHTLSVLDSSLLLAMAYDRFVAICCPLRYSSLLTRPLTSKLGLLSVFRGVAIILPIPLMLHISGLCKGSQLSHAFCLHPDITRLLCSRLPAIDIYSLFAVLSTMGLDALLITLSYVLILKAVCSLSSPYERCKAFHKCAGHITMVLLFYCPMIGLSLSHRFGGHKTPFIHVPLAYLHFLLPPAINPIVYGVRSKSVYQRLLHRLCGAPIHSKPPSVQ
ncbi:olfactory receptor 51G2-like [Dendropsophus ebraccatus]|uniref:olfactory receptor 51G2-like n=1 Tax=Dendropsophus ebraccatus TaxID=150705 RepID=UPI003831F12F